METELPSIPMLGFTKYRTFVAMITTGRSVILLIVKLVIPRIRAATNLVVYKSRDKCSS